MGLGVIPYWLSSMKKMAVLWCWWLHPKMPAKVDKNKAATRKFKVLWIINLTTVIYFHHCLGYNFWKRNPQWDSTSIKMKNHLQALVTRALHLHHAAANTSLLLLFSPRKLGLYSSSAPNRVIPQEVGLGGTLPSTLFSLPLSLSLRTILFWLPTHLGILVLLHLITES